MTNHIHLLATRGDKASISNTMKVVGSRYIELNPVAANMVKRPEEYVWSSYHSNAWGDASWLTQHEEYKRLGRTQEKRCQHYRELFKHLVDSEDIDLIRGAMHYCQPVGDDRFRKMLEEKYGVKLGQTRRGRPANG